MPYYQLDLPGSYPAHLKNALARTIAVTHAAIMEAQPDIVSVSFRELGAGNVLRYQAGEMREFILMMCEVRRGRPADQRLRLAQALQAEIARAFAWPIERIVIEFTQHEGDEMFRDGAWGPTWSPGEAAKS